MAESTVMVALTARELEACVWCVNTLSSSWHGAPNGTAIDGLKDKLEAAILGDARGALTKGPGFTG